MKSHEYAEKLKAAAEFLLARENVQIEKDREQPYIPLFYWNKESFIAAVRAVGPGVKKWTDDELRFTPNGPCGIFTLIVQRHTVCRLVRPAEYDCEPILSEEEAATL